MNKTLAILGWGVVALLGAAAVGTIAVHRGEPINALWLVVAATCCYALGYRFYSKFIAVKILALDGLRATPAERLENGRDFLITNKWVVFGHHFAAIAGPGPLVGPVLAAQFGYPLADWVRMCYISLLRRQRTPRSGFPPDRSRITTRRS